MSPKRTLDQELAWRLATPPEDWPLMRVIAQQTAVLAQLRQDIRALIAVVEDRCALR